MTTTEERPETAPGKTEAPNARPQEAITILIAEDTPDHRLIMQVYLRDTPFLLTFAKDGKAALERFASSDFDLILMDMNMPLMDGLATTRAMRALGRERGSLPVSIVALTAGSAPQVIKEALDAGCDGFVSKPMSKLQLLTVIEKYRRR